MLRALLIWLSQQPRLERAVVASRLLRPMIRRFVAGETAADALEAAEGLRGDGYRSAVELLGEDVFDPAAARAAADAYVELVGQIGLQGLSQRKRPLIAIKPSLLGLQIGLSEAERNLSAVVEAADAAGVTVEIDMEASYMVDATLRLYRRAAERSPRTAVALQAYLRRTPHDLGALIDDGIARVRLVKGAYSEPVEIAYPRADEVRHAFRDLLMTLWLSETASAGESFVGVATHDPKLHEAAREMASEYEIGEDRWEFQMLLGVRPRLRAGLLADGYPVRVSVPYGERWYPYTLRRLGERPANFLFGLRAVAGLE